MSRCMTMDEEYRKYDAIAREIVKAHTRAELVDMCAAWEAETDKLREEELDIILRCGRVRALAGIAVGERNKV